TPAATIEVSTEQSKPGEKAKTRKKTHVIRLGSRDAGRLFVTTQDWPRVNEVGDELGTLVLDKSALDFRHKQLFDFAEAAVRRLVIARLARPSVTAGVLGLMATPPSLGRLGFLPATLSDRSEIITLERSSDGWAMTTPVRAQTDKERARGLAERL